VSRKKIAFDPPVLEQIENTSANKLQRSKKLENLVQLG